MVRVRSAIALDPRLFGRGQPRLLGGSEEYSWTPSDDLKFFATTFAAGFLFVSILIA
ncbi:MAG TPA: hypothetical protein VFS69_05640 [Sphingomicrobium sp.]|nr:hypothetical protein [Sphingomicrobium sp.]